MDGILKLMSGIRDAALQLSTVLDSMGIAYAVGGSLRFGRPFNLIHLETGFKIDIFSVRSHALGPQQLKRRRVEQSSILGGPAVAFPVISPEDTILVKLRWYRDGGETSERQWNESGRIIGAP